MGTICPRNIQNEAGMTKMVKVLVLVLMLTVMLPISPAQACAFGVPDWSMMSDEQIVSTINGAEDVLRIMAGENGELPPGPPGYRYDDSYRLVPL
jgi:hypothetical protein